MAAADHGALVIAPERVLRGMMVATFGLTLVSGLGQFSKYVLSHDHLMGLVPLTDLNGEANLPAWFSSSALLACGAVAGLIGSLSRLRGCRDACWWLGLAALFTYLSLDEAASLHERWGDPLKVYVAPLPYLYYAWVVPGLAAVAVIGGAYLQFFLRLPAHTRWCFAAAAIMFVGGGIGVEMVAGMHVTQFGKHNFGYALLVMLEESGELLGMAAFLYGAFRYLGAAFATIRVEVRPLVACEAPDGRPREIAPAAAAV